jgi:hypothetical protein
MGVEARLYNELNKGEIVVAMSGLAGHAVYLLVEINKLDKERTLVVSNVKYRTWLKNLPKIEDYVIVKEPLC